MSEELTPLPGRLAPGSQLAGYRVEEEIGRGGMAVVYRAYDDHLDRRVALKVLAPDLARDEVFRVRFIQESRIAAATEHFGLAKPSAAACRQLRPRTLARRRAGPPPVPIARSSAAGTSSSVASSRRISSTAAGSLAAVRPAAWYRFSSLAVATSSSPGW